MRALRRRRRLLESLSAAAALLLSAQAFALQLDEAPTWLAAVAAKPGVMPSGPAVSGPLVLSLQFEAALPPATGIAATSEKLLQTALNYLGVRYRFGQKDESGTDCSGLIQTVFAAVGYRLPRSTAELIQDGEPVSEQAIQPGDLLFYRWRRNQLHVALYMSDDLILHASPTAGKVILTRLEGDWRKRLVAVRRVM